MSEASQPEDWADCIEWHARALARGNCRGCNAPVAKCGEQPSLCCSYCDHVTPDYDRYLIRLVDEQGERVVDITEQVQARAQALGWVKPHQPVNP